VSTPSALPTSLPTNLPPRRIFADAALQGALDKALLGVPDGHRFAVVAHADLKEFVLVARADQGPWSIAAFAKKEWKGAGLEAGAEVRFSM
jgi:hypothetical protein